MNPFILGRLSNRLLPIIPTIRQCLSAAASSSSSKPESSASDKILVERNRAKEPERMSPGEVWSKANMAVQMYDTSMEDNFQRTTVTSVNQEMGESKRNAIHTYSETGFKLFDESILLGPIALFPKTALSWRITTPEEITPESMVLFTLLEPKLDIVVVGVGDAKYVRPVTERLLPLFRKHRILLEVLDTPDACASFNYLNGEGRYVAAALFPALEIKVPSTDRERHISPKDWDRVRHGWFGFSDVESRDPADYAQKKLEQFSQKMKAQGYKDPDEVESEKPKSS